MTTSMPSINTANDHFRTNSFPARAENPLFSGVGKASEVFENANLIDDTQRKKARKNVFRCYFHCSQGTPRRRSADAEIDALHLRVACDLSGRPRQCAAAELEHVGVIGDL